MSAVWICMYTLWWLLCWFICSLSRPQLIFRALIVQKWNVHSTLGSSTLTFGTELMLTLLSTAQSLLRLVLGVWSVCVCVCVDSVIGCFYESLPPMWFHRKSVGSRFFYWLCVTAKTLKQYVTTTHTCRDCEPLRKDLERCCTCVLRSILRVCRHA